MQHSPPLCVLQQQSTSATLHLSLVDASAVACGTQHRELSECLAQLGAAVTEEKVPKINVKAITMILTMELSALLAPYTMVAKNYVARAEKNWAVDDPLPVTPEEGAAVIPREQHAGRKGNGWRAGRGHEVKPKYRDSVTNETWTGRGRAASWPKRKHGAGNDINDYHV